jgi:NAD(P)-dependent dehydrogenase (short-subunit alcohol dehydrogenase family)
MSSPDFSLAIDYARPPLAGRTALVFGAGVCGPGWGNGEAAAVAYADAGAAVACVDLDIARAQATVDLIASRGGTAIAYAADVSDAVGVEAAVAGTARHFGRLDIVHNNVGMSPAGDPVTMDQAVWDRTFEVNVRSVFLACKFALPIMRAARRGVITNISSLLGSVVSEYDLSSYYASKAAVDHLTRSLAVSNGPYGIRANAIQPGLMDTPQIHAHEDIVTLHGSQDDTRATRDAMSPLRHQGSGWDIGHVAVFLASDMARYVNGVVLPVDGGLLCKQAAQPTPLPPELAHG